VEIIAELQVQPIVFIEWIVENHCRKLSLRTNAYLTIIMAVLIARTSLKRAPPNSWVATKLVERGARSCAPDCLIHSAMTGYITGIIR
jgi:hypothetical protein